MTFWVAEKAVILRKGKMLVLEKARHETFANESAWDLPGGRFEHGEQPFDCLKREVKEEVGLHVKPIKPLWQWTLIKPGLQNVLTAWLCEASGKMRLSDEHLSAEWVSLKEFKKKKYPDWLRVIAEKAEEEC
jgi:8-oxo-dGTP diphosphatase